MTDTDVPETRAVISLASATPVLDPDGEIHYASIVVGELSVSNKDVGTRIEATELHFAHDEELAVVELDPPIGVWVPPHQVLMIAHMPVADEDEDEGEDEDEDE